MLALIRRREEAGFQWPDGAGAAECRPNRLHTIDLRRAGERSGEATGRVSADFQRPRNTLSEPILLP